MKRGLTIRALLIISVATCSCDSDGFDLDLFPRSDNFQCGRRLDDNSITLCDAVDQACICATQSCARRDTSCVATNLRYLDSPYARSDLAGACVPSEDLVQVITSDNPTGVCTSVVDGGSESTGSTDAKDAESETTSQDTAEAGPEVTPNDSAETLDSATLDSDAD